MKSARRILAALVLTVWMLAIGHVAIEHCAAMNGGCVVTCHAHTDGCHDGKPEGEEHHHHLTAFASSPLAKVLDLKTSVLWRAFGHALAERLAEMLRASAEQRGVVVSWESPPDERAAGWLLVCRTALPVRGPSLAA